MDSSLPRVLNWLNSVDSAADQNFLASYPSLNRPKKRELEGYSMEVGGLDNDKTPRPVKKIRSATETELAPPTTLPQSNDGDTFDSASSVSSSIASTKSNISSPTKRKIELDFLKPRIVFERQADWRKQRASLEDKLPLLRNLTSLISAANRCLPGGMREFFQDIEDDLQPEHTPFSDDDDTQPFSDLASFVDKMRGGIDYCMQKDSIEGAWCDRLVWPCLDAAVSRMSDISKIDAINVKDIQIAPKRLLPSSASEVASSRTRTDYVLGTPARDHVGGDTLLESALDRSVCQSTHPSVHNLILFATVEVKRPVYAGHGLDQLGTWCAAGFKKLLDLAPHPPGTARAPSQAVHCLWSWRGPIASLYLAIETETDRISVFPVRNWDTTSPGRLVNLIMTLSGIMTWGRDHYGPWFIEYVNAHNSR